MGLNINLFIHGVPMGQKIWGPKNDDQIYISSFYGPKWDASEVMKIDVMTFNGVTYCYYSFIKGQNVFDSQGRAGSYIALTLRINAFYADIQNMYSILKAAYEKMCVGLCVVEANGATKYLLSDFQSVDTKLKEIENHILNYIREFSIDDDIISLNGFSISGQGAIQNINLHECTRKVGYEMVRRFGKLMVSPWYLSASAANTVAQYKAEIQAITEKAQKEIQIQEQTSQERINNITKHYQDELRTSKEESQQQLTFERENSERRIAEIKNNYAEVDSKLNSMGRTIKDREKEISDLQSQCRRKDKEIEKNNRNVQKLEQQISRLQDEFNELLTNKGIQPIQQKSKPPKKKWTIIGIVSFFAILLIALLTWFIVHSFNTQKEIIKNLQEKIEQHRTNSEASILNNSFDTEETANPSKDNDNTSIVVEEFTNGKDFIKVGEMCHVSLSDKNSECERGKWVSKEFNIERNTIIAKREYAGNNGKISYVVNDDTIASIIIKIRNDKNE